MKKENQKKIIAIDMSECSKENISPQQRQERAIAIYDLLENNLFSLLEIPGPYKLILSKETRHLLFDVRSENNLNLNSFYFAMGPFRKLIRDYNQVCESYYDAIRTKPPSQIESIDMGRRALHNEGAELIIDRLNGKIDLDNDTARRLFTLICILQNS